MSPLEALANQIRAVFSDNEDLRRALRGLPDGDDIVDTLPSVHVPRLEFIHQLVRLCDARGLLPELQDIARASSRRDAETTTAIRIRHPLQPAPQFFGREDILAALRVWWSTRNAVTIHTIIGPGGCGKTALVERFIRSLRDTTTDLALYVWSFYEDTDCQTFLDDVTQWGGFGRRVATPLDRPRRPRKHPGHRERGRRPRLSVRQRAERAAPLAADRSGGGRLPAARDIALLAHRPRAVARCDP
jgi:hypothetical protein